MSWGRFLSWVVTLAVLVLARPASAAPPLPVTDIHRPLLVVLVDFSDMPFGRTASNVPRNTAFYDQLFFGPGFPNVRDYFFEASAGKFTFSKAQVVGPVRYREGTREVGRAAALADAVRFRGVVVDSLRSSLNFDAWDRNRDGLVDMTELTIVFVAAGGISGASRPIGDYGWPDDPKRKACHPLGTAVTPREPRADDKWVCGQAAGVDEGAGFETITHEVTHALGMGSDLYGPWGSRYVSHNLGATIMHGTVRGPDDRTTLLADPYTRYWLGWATPRVVSASDPSTCLWIDATHLAARRSGPSREPIRITHPQRADEGFMLDYRRRADVAVPVGQPPITGYDANVGGTGVLFWYVREKNGQLDRVELGVEKGFDAQNNDLALVGRKRAGTDDVDIDRTGDGVPDLVLWGPNFRFESGPAQGTDGLLGTNTMLSTSLTPRNVGGKWVNVTTMFGNPQWVGPAPNDVRLIGIDGFDFGVSATVGREDNGRIPVRLTTSRPMGSADAACLDATSYRAPLVMVDTPDCVDVKGNTVTKFGVTLKLAEPAREAGAITLDTFGTATLVTGPSRIEAKQSLASYTFVTAGTSSTPIKISARIAWPDQNFAPRTQTLTTTILRGSDTPAVKGGSARTCAAHRALAGELANLRVDPAVLSAPIRPLPPRGSVPDHAPPFVMKPVRFKFTPIVPKIPVVPAIPKGQLK